MINQRPRIVVVTRPTAYEALLARHATHDQAAFFLKQRGQSIKPVHEEHVDFLQVMQSTSVAIPNDWRRSNIRREDLDRYLFEPNDIVVVVGQDGLVPNVAKYLHGQSVIGINPDARQYDGVLVRHSVDRLPELLHGAAGGNATVESRTMVRATLDDGQQLVALNELFIGVRSHQSARYSLSFGEQSERHSSSGLIVATGTGSTGWARSIRLQRRSQLPTPSPAEEQLVFYVREPFPSVVTGTSLTEGLLKQEQTLSLTSENYEGGVVFGDGIEDDYLNFNWGSTLAVDIADRKLNLIVDAKT